MISLEISAQGVPHPRLHLVVHALERHAPAFDRVVDGDVVLQRVGIYKVRCAGMQPASIT
jgi:hypothetical protein